MNLKNHLEDIIIKAGGKDKFRQGVIMTTTITLLLLSVFVYASARYTLSLETQVERRCLPYSAFLVDTWDKDLVRGHYFKFKSRNMEPYYPDDTLIVKQLTGIPGDDLIIDKNVTINGKRIAELEDIILEKTHTKSSDYIKAEKIPDNKYFASGTLPRSFDSRYWGYVDFAQVEGRAYALW